MACVVKKDPEVEKAFWSAAKGKLAQGVDPFKVIQDLAKEHGIGTDAVGAILMNKGGLFKLTNEAWAKQAQVHELKYAAKREIQTADFPTWAKVALFPYESTRRLLTIGHGGVIPFTHARNSMYLPGEQKMFGEAVRDAYSYMTPNTGSARWLRDMTDLRNQKDYNFKARVGLDIKAQSVPVGMGMSRWTRMSFDALKPLRSKLFDKYWSKMDDHSFEAAQTLAAKINHATGSINLPSPVSRVAGATMFAPKLRAAKYASGIVDPLSNKFAAKRFAKMAAVNLGLLGINDMLNRAFGRDQDKVNWTEPSRADWLRMKIGGLTIPMAPMFETARLPIALLATAIDPREKDKWRIAAKEVASAAHPGINAIYGALTGTDLATGKTLPFKGLSQVLHGDYRNQKEGRNITKGEYAAGYAPIPAQPFVKSMTAEGVPPDVAHRFIQPFVETIASGGAGTHVYENIDYKDKQYPRAKGGGNRP